MNTPENPTRDPEVSIASRGATPLDSGTLTITRLAVSGEDPRYVLALPDEPLTTRDVARLHAALDEASA